VRFGSTMNRTRCDGETGTVSKCLGGTTPSLPGNGMSIIGHQKVAVVERQRLWLIRSPEP
jgi:hypothetical protein